MAAAAGTLTPEARESLERVRRGSLRGIIHGLILYELVYHWHKGRLPGFKSEEELAVYLTTLFSSAPLSESVLRLAARIKSEGDEILKRAEDKQLRGRRLSACDAITIAVALQRSYPVLSGDADLTYVAGQIGVKTIW